MTIKTPKSLIEEALKEIKTISPSEALKLSKENKCNLIDIRDTIELQSSGTIENSFHIPRGMLEFSIHPESPFFKNENLDPNKEISFPLSVVEFFKGEIGIPMGGFPDKL